MTETVIGYLPAVMMCLSSPSFTEPAVESCSANLIPSQLCAAANWLRIHCVVILNFMWLLGWLIQIDLIVLILMSTNNG